jgi:chromatin structure-remodeling complex subunit RSC9
MRGSNIYMRCLYGLRSEIPQEQDFALHHLVKVSFERGDKYKFDSFPQLAEALIEKALEISTLIHGIKWTVSYEADAGLQIGDVLNGAFGTQGLYERLQTLPVLKEADSLEPAEFSHKLVKLNEAALVIRNMVMLEENALFLSKFFLLRDFLSIALNLPEQERLAEYHQYALDIAEQVTKFWELEPTSALYQSLLKKLTSEDRGVFLSSARAIARIGMENPQPSRLTDIPISIIETLASYLLLDSDDELMLASLDLLYQYTALPENMTLLLTSEPAILRHTTPRLVSLLLHNAQSHEQKLKVKEAERAPPITKIPDLPDDLYRQLRPLPEPERSTKWLKCCFEEAANEDITQIAIWQAYQGQFQNDSPIPAADFIKNVSSSFTAAQAQVINTSPNPRFIIKGIRPRRTLVGTKGEIYQQCLWQRKWSEQLAQTTTEIDSCGLWFSLAEDLWAHVVKDHLSVPLRADGKFSAIAKGSYQCNWLGCTKHAKMAETSALEAGRHVRLHVKRSPNTPNADTAASRSSDIIREAEYVCHPFCTTQVDEKGSPTGIPYIATLILKNFARHAIRQQQGGLGEEASVKEDLFDDVRVQLWDNFVLNKTLRLDLDHLMSMLYKADAAQSSNVDEGAVNDGDASRT